MNTKQTAALTGIPEPLLQRLRARETRTLKGGPPYRKALSRSGKVSYVYDRPEVERWLKIKRCIITQGDAAMLLDCSRDELGTYSGLRSFELRGENNGKLIINNGKNFYLWIPL